MQHLYYYSFLKKNIPISLIIPSISVIQPCICSRCFSMYPTNSKWWHLNVLLFMVIDSNCSEKNELI